MKPLVRRTVVVLLICVAAAAAGMWFYRGMRLKQVFDKVALGDSGASVERELGLPDRKEACPDSLYFGNSQYLGPNDGMCVVIWRYNHFIGSYAMGFDAKEAVVSKYKYTSE